MNKSIIATLLSYSLLSCGLHAVDSTLQLRHRDPGGVGYSQGYTSVDYFLATEGDTAEFLLDLRGHVFNDARFAGNAGLGVRFPLMDCEYRLGANAFYDFRDASNLFAHQVGAGLEWLGETFDVRMNGYIPFGAESKTEERAFKGFRGHHVMIYRKSKDTLPCIDAEVGIPMPDWCYFAAGPYYLLKQRNHGLDFGGAWGAKVRAEMTFVRYLTVGFQITHDHIFHTRAQGILAINLPIGKWNKRSEQEGRVFSQVRIMRNEIIPIEVKKKRLTPLTHYIEAKEEKKEKKPKIKEESPTPSEDEKPVKKPKKKKEKEPKPEKEKPAPAAVVEQPEQPPPEKKGKKVFQKVKKIKQKKKHKLKKKEIEEKEEETVKFVFVDNKARKKKGDGSYEKPFPSLKEAESQSKPGDVIYVFPGDGTAKNMNEGIVLKDEQVLASSGSPLFIENVIIPPQTPGEKPAITNIHEEHPVITNPGNTSLDDFLFVPPWQFLFENWSEASPAFEAGNPNVAAEAEGFHVMPPPVEPNDGAGDNFVLVDNN